MSHTDLSTLLGLISHYSPSGHECPAVTFLLQQMRSLGFDKTFRDEAGNAVGVMGNGPKQLIFLGHIDTVPGEIEIKQEHGLLYGRGVVDAKGPLACFVDAVARLGNIQGWQFVVIGAVDEERNSTGAQFVAGQYRPDFAIVGEPNQWDRIALGYKGFAGLDVTIKRGNSHSAGAEKTAVEEAIDIWLKIKTYADQYNLDQPKLFDQILPSLKDIQSGSSEFEQWSKLKIDIRLPVAVSPLDMYRIFYKMLDISNSQHILAEPGGFAIPAWRCDKNTPLVRAFLKSIRAQGGQPRFAYKTGTADLNVVGPSWQCPMVVYGPGDSALDHTPNEHIEIEEYFKAVDVLSGALSGLVSTA